jgi:hypothetical protein
MRRILVTLAAISVAAAGAAAVQAAPQKGAHRGGPPPGTSAPTGDFMSVNHRNFGRGTGRGDGRHHGRARRGEGGDRLGYRLGYVEAIPYGAELDSHGSGFFAGRGGTIRIRNGRPVYEYDRAYPYEWGRPTAAPATVWAAARRDDRAARCSIEQGVRVCRDRR